MTTQKVITRFAPSPTGFLHIGGARTALFNWLFSKNMGGEFRLRIEDTDKARSTEAATQAILDGMAWLGLDADNEIVYQSQNADAHVKAANALLANGKAYKCYCTPEELDELRSQYREKGLALRSPWRDSDDSLDKPYTVRFRVPAGQTSISDKVQGDITWQNDQFDDLVLLRADGTPTYMLAVVVDDHDMGITHVIRGDDHLINAGRQKLIYEALDWDVPVFAHVPLIHGPDGKKLSKRHGALGVEAYRDMGYIPDGLRNYLLKLGWSQGDQELFFDDEAIQAFTLSGLNDSPARLDFDKMDFINAQHIQRLEDETLFELSLPFIQAESAPLSDAQKTQLLAAMDSLKPRVKTLKDMAEQSAYLFLERPLSITGKAKKSLKNDALERLGALSLRLQDVDYKNWTAENLQTCIKTFAEDQNIGFGKIGQPLRAALTAGHPSPDLSVVLALIGKDEVLGRISDIILQPQTD